MKSKQRGEITTIMLVIMAGMLIWSLSGRHEHMGMGPMGLMHHAAASESPGASAPASAPAEHTHAEPGSKTAP
jgi:hypothetical protein